MFADHLEKPKFSLDISVIINIGCKGKFLLGGRGVTQPTRNLAARGLKILGSVHDVYILYGRILSFYVQMPQMSRFDTHRVE